MSFFTAFFLQTAHYSWTIPCLQLLIF